MKNIFIIPGQLNKISIFLSPWFAFFSFILLLFGLWLSFFNSPVDYQQGNAVRILYIHAPSAWLSMLIYSFLAINSFFGLVYGHVTAFCLARASAPIGLTFTAICLVTGSIWGKPMWGTWWVWDARLTSVLVLFFSYIGYIVFSKSFTFLSQLISPNEKVFLKYLISLKMIIGFNLDKLSKITCGYASTYDGKIKISDLL